MEAACVVKWKEQFHLNGTENIDVSRSFIHIVQNCNFVQASAVARVL